MWYLYGLHPALNASVLCHIKLMGSLASTYMCMYSTTVRMCAVQCYMYIYVYTVQWCNVYSGTMR